MLRITIPSSVKEIEEGAFGVCSAMKEVEFESQSSLKKNGPLSFQHCGTLNQITIPSLVTEIYHDAFQNCTLLEQVTFEIPSSIKLVDKDVFSLCSPNLRIVNYESINTKCSNA